MAEGSTSRGRGRTRRETNIETNELRETLGTILARLNALEHVGVPSTSARASSQPPALDERAMALPSAVATCSPHSHSTALSAMPTPERVLPPSVGEVSVPASNASTIGDSTANTTSSPDVTERLIGALSALSKVRSNHYYISNFDPSLHDIDSWCEEVDRARSTNCWDDNECISRIANCLKGDARSWLNDWVTNDRTWSNFKVEFKPLCSRRIDIANILFEVMCTNSDDYSTYAEYARRSVLRLNIVKGLSEELTVAIVIRGITDAQVRAAATNAHLLPKDLVEFLSIYTKPVKSESTASTKSSQGKSDRKRPYNNKKPDIKCFSCGELGHPKRLCSKRVKTEEQSGTGTSHTSDNRNAGSEKKIPCSFCKKVGHDVTICFAKQRSEKRNQSNVNFCRELKGASTDSDVTTAVIQGVPTDVLIDTGSRISLISEPVLKHFKCSQQPAYQTLRGIGDQNIVSKGYVTLVIEFSDISLEVDLFVVPQNCMTVPVLIGTDVLNRDGVTYLRANNEQRITRVSCSCDQQQVMHIDSSSEPEIKTSLQGNDRDKLMSVLNEFKDSFIVGTAHTTVTTGEMHIKLTSDTPVHYRPYRLSYDEKLKVRKICRDLLDKGIIRESESPYASPIILVKKKDGRDRICASTIGHSTLSQ